MIIRSKQYKYIITFIIITVMLVSVVFPGLYSDNAQSNSSKNNYFSPLEYNITFNETGLPEGATWYINITSNVSLGPIIGSSCSINLPNGTYYYTVSTDNKIYSASYNNTFTVNGSSLNKTITFSPVMYKVTFNETGLLPGATWNVNLNGSTERSNTSTIVFSETNGTYSFKVSSAGYSAVPESGIINVNGSSYTKAIDFEKVDYNVTVTESNLPSGTLWYFNLTDGESFKSTTDKIVFNETNGTYNYTSSSVNKNYSKLSGHFTVDGSSSNVTIKFSELAYKVTFNENGLPAATTWYVNITNGVSSGPIIGSSYSINLPNGTYTYTVSTDNKRYSASYNNAFTEKGLPLNENITFSTVMYKVTFNESGLPSGTLWNVTLNGIIKSSYTSTIVFNETNGTYQYLISNNNNDYKPTISEGKLTVNGHGLSESVSFINVTYKVTFNENGLPAATTWYVNITNGVSSGPIIGSSYSINLPNGTYTYTVSSNNNIYKPIYTDSFTVNGKSIPESINFSKVVYSVKVTESGLPTGTLWYLYLNGESFKSTTNTINIVETNGTYNYTLVSSNTNFIPVNYYNNFKVNGNPIKISVYFEDIEYKERYEIKFTETGLPGDTLWFVYLNGIMKNSNTSTIVFNEINGTYSYTVASADNYSATPSSGNFTINGNTFNLSIKYNKDAHIKLNIITSGSKVTINGNNIKVVDGSIDKYLKQGYYYINVTQNNYKSYTDYVFLSYNNNYYINISLIKINNAGYLSGVINPYDALIAANGVIIPVYNGVFNESLYPGTYYVSITANGYSGIIDKINITPGKVSYLNVSLIKISNSITLSGYIDPGSASIMFNGFIAYVNSTGYYYISLPAGGYTVSLYYSGYFPYSKNISAISSEMLNFTLVKEPAYTSYYFHSNTVIYGYNANVYNVVNGNGNISMNFNSSDNGTIILMIPYIYTNTSMHNILYSTVYINGIFYSNYTITISSNYTVILTVKGLSGDPSLDWKYLPTAHVPVVPHKVANHVVIPTIVYEIIAFIAVIGIQISAAIIYIKKKNDKVQ